MLTDEAVMLLISKMEYMLTDEAVMLLISKMERGEEVDFDSMAADTLRLTRESCEICGHVPPAQICEHGVENNSRCSGCGWAANYCTCRPPTAEDEEVAEITSTDSEPGASAVRS